MSPPYDLILPPHRAGKRGGRTGRGSERISAARASASSIVMRRSRRMNHTMRTPLVDTFNDEPSFDTGEEVSVKESERVREDEEPPSYVDVVVDARVRATLDTTLPALPALPTVP